MSEPKAYTKKEVFFNVINSRDMKPPLCPVDDHGGQYCLQRDYTQANAPPTPVPRTSLTS